VSVLPPFLGLPINARIFMILLPMSLIYEE
jgi:hypothetical protein